MSKEFRRLLVAVALLLGGASIRAQSFAGAASNVPATEAFAGIHRALDQHVDTLLAEQGRETATSPAKDQDTAVDLLARVSAEESTPVPAGTLSPAMRRLEDLRPLLNPILQREGIPTEIAFVIVVESGGKVDALSPKGARGLWQLMPETARRYGLVVETERDERLDIEKSARAAARYLRNLHVQFGSWPTALAAYNAWEQVVQKAIAHAGEDTFSALSSRRFLPAETRLYVPTVMNLIARSGSSTDFSEQVKGSQGQWIVYAVRTKEVSGGPGVTR